MLLFGRVYRMSVSPVSFGDFLPFTLEQTPGNPGLRISFDIVVTPDGNPNRGTIRVYNLAPDLRTAINSKRRETHGA